MKITKSQLKQIIKEEIDRAKTKFAMIGLLYLFSDKDVVSPFAKPTKEQKKIEKLREIAYWLENSLEKEKPPSHLEKNIKKTHDYINKKILSKPDQVDKLAGLGKKWKVERLQGTQTIRTSGASTDKTTKKNIIKYEWGLR